MTTTEFLGLLPGVERVHKGWIARCPAHDDRNPSLSIAEGVEGRTLVCCHAGCKTDAICTALGIPVSDLFGSLTKRQAPRRIEATYNYYDSDGVLRFQAVRYMPKSFAYRRPNPSGEGWDYGIGDGERPLYNLREVIANPDAVVWIVEGEKDADRLASIGHVGVCNPCGATKWLENHTQSLAGRRCVIVRDMDLPGLKHAAMVYRELTAAGCQVKVLEPAKGKDISDHLDEGLGLAELKPSDVSGVEEDQPGLEESEETFPDTDLGRARMLAARVKNRMRYVLERGAWMTLDGSVWRPEPSGDGRAIGESMKMLGEIAKRLRLEAKQHYKAGDSEAGDKCLTKASACEGARRIKDAASLAKQIEAVQVRAGDLDAKPNLVGVENGVLDVDRGQLVADPGKALVTKRCGCAFKPDAKAPVFQEFLSQIMGGDQVMVRLLEDWMGYTLGGTTELEKLLLAHGERGRNGKTTWLAAMNHVLGDYAGAIDKSLLMDTRETPRFSLANLEGLRCVIASEIKPGASLDVEFVKTLVTGREPIQAERKGVQGYDFYSKGKVIFATNSLPYAAMDSALLSRLLVVPFDISFRDITDSQYRPGDLPPNRHLDEQLRAEAEGILALMVRWRIRYLKEGMAIPAKALAAASEYEQAVDAVALWMGEKCEQDAEARSTAMDLFKNFVEFCKDGRLPVPGRYNEFVARLRGMPGIGHIKPNNKSTFTGIRLAGSDAQPWWSD